MDGQGGNDYLDAGAGDDSEVHGGPGNDVVRGGDNNDIIHGDEGIDQMYGDSGSDAIYAEAGSNDTFDDSGGIQAGQRLWGGPGIDSLYAYAEQSLDETDERGDELHGGAGGDLLFGNLRRDVLIGDGDNDTILGDGVRGPGYMIHAEAATVGGDDTLRGGPGEDKLYGGGGNDYLRGGSNSDWLEGQDGFDAIFGDAGIDLLVLDAASNYSYLGDMFDGHFGPAGDDHNTDILLFEGHISRDDIIQVSESEVGITGNTDAFVAGPLSTRTTFKVKLNAKPATHLVFSSPTTSKRCQC